MTRAESKKEQKKSCAHLLLQQTTISLTRCIRAPKCQGAEKYQKLLPWLFSVVRLLRKSSPTGCKLSKRGCFGWLTRSGDGKVSSEHGKSLPQQRLTCHQNPSLKHTPQTRNTSLTISPFSHFDRPLPGYWIYRFTLFYLALHKSTAGKPNTLRCHVKRRQITQNNIAGIRFDYDNLCSKNIG